MARKKVTKAVKDFWNKLEELLGEFFQIHKKTLKSSIAVKPKGDGIIARIAAVAAKLLGLGKRRLVLKGRVPVVIGEISRAMALS